MHLIIPPWSLPTEPDRTLSIGRLLASLRRGWWLIVGCGLGCAVIAYVASARIPRSYVASGMLVVETKRFAIPELQGAVSDQPPDPMPAVRTEAVLLQSPSLVAEVAHELNLDLLPAFNPALRPVSMFDAAKGWLRELTEVAETPVVSQEDRISRAVAEEAARRLTVTHDNRSFTLALDFVAPDPWLAATFVNALMRHHIDQIVHARAELNREAGKSLRERAEVVHAEMEALELQVRETRARMNLVLVRAGSERQQNLEDLATAATRATLARTQAEADLARATALRESGRTDRLADVLNSATIGSLRQRETEAVRKVSDLASRLGPDHPTRNAAEVELAAIRHQIDAEIVRVAASIEAKVRIAHDQEAAARRQLEEGRDVAVLGGRAQSEIVQIEREADARRQLYRTLLERAEQAAADPRAVGEVPGVRIVTAAVPSVEPSAPRPTLSGFIGAIAGFALGGLLAVTRGHVAGGLLTAQGITDVTGLTVLGTVPPPRRSQRRLTRAQQVLDDPAGPQAEALRELRTRLKAWGHGPVPRSVVFVPVDSGPEDSAAVAAAFARVVAMDGERVALVEGDLRRPILARLLGMRETETGADALLRVLAQRECWRDLVVHDAVTRLRLLLAGCTPDAAAHGLLSGTRFQSLLGELNGEHTLVVLSAPSPLTSADALALVGAADAVLLVFASGDRFVAHRSVERLRLLSWHRSWGAVLVSAR